MAQYTVELRHLIESGAVLFDFDYEFYDVTKKDDFEQKFIRHFYFREIGTETLGRFKHNLRVTFDEKLPYYNVLFNASLLEYDKTTNYDMTENLTKTRGIDKDITAKVIQGGTTVESSETGDNAHTITDHTTTNALNNLVTKNLTTTEDTEKDTISDTTVDDKKVESDTPNGLLAMADIQTNVYASKANVQDGATNTTDNEIATGTKHDTGTENTDITGTVGIAGDNTYTNTRVFDANVTADNTTDTTHNQTDTETEDYTLTRKGNIGVMTASDILEKHLLLQKKLTTILTQFFDDCEDLFMQIY